jgi:hypothetical protein
MQNMNQKGTRGELKFNVEAEKEWKAQKGNVWRLDYFDLFRMNFSALQLHKQTFASNQLKFDQNQSRYTKIQTTFLTGRLGNTLRL